MPGLKKRKELEQTLTKPQPKVTPEASQPSPSPANETVIAVSDEVSNANEESELENEGKRETVVEKKKSVKLETPPRKKRKKRKKPPEQKPGKKCTCNKYCCKICCKKCCPYFPGCCELPLQNCLQLLAVADLIITIFNIGIWVFFHQYDPFTRNAFTLKNTTTTQVTTSTTSSTEASNNKGTSKFDADDFHESSTALYGIVELDSVDGDAVKFSKIGYVYRHYQQEVENMCGRAYYSEFLLGRQLTLTNGVFNDILMLTYFTEIVYQFIDVSILATTCCFFDYTSGRLYLIIIWNLELAPILAKYHVIVESRSHRLCILQYGLGKTFRGLDALLILHFVPLILFRLYKLLVFTFFVTSMLELGNLEHQTRIQGVTLHEYVESHEEYLRMDTNREKSSSEDDEVDNV